MGLNVSDQKEEYKGPKTVKPREFLLQLSAKSPLNISPNPSEDMPSFRNSFLSILIPKYKKNTNSFIVMFKSAQPNIELV